MRAHNGNSNCIWFYCIDCYLFNFRCSDLSLDLQWVPNFPAHRSPSLCLPEDRKSVHIQGGSSGCRKLLLLRFQSHHRAKRLLQVHPPYPFTPRWWLVDCSCAAAETRKKLEVVFILGVIYSFLVSGEERKYPADIRVKFPDTTAMLASNITLECFALGKLVFTVYSFRISKRVLLLSKIQFIITINNFYVSVPSLILFGGRWTPQTFQRITRSVNQELCFICSTYSMRM